MTGKKLSVIGYLLLVEDVVQSRQLISTLYALPSNIASFPNTECRKSNTDSLVPNAEYRMPNT